MRNEDNWGKVGTRERVELRTTISEVKGVAAVEDKMRKNWLGWFGQVNWRPADASVRRCDYETKAQDEMGRGRPPRLWKRLRKDMAYLELTEIYICLLMTPIRSLGWIASWVEHKDGECGTVLTHYTCLW